MPTKKKRNTSQAKPVVQPELKPQVIRCESRLARIAASLVAGKTVTDIARAEGITRTYASDLANCDLCKQYIAEFVEAEVPELQALFYRGLRVIQHGLAARKEYMDKEGFIRKGGPDHYARIASFKALQGLMVVGRPSPERPEKQEQRSEVTMAELRAILARGPKEAR